MTTGHRYSKLLEIAQQNDSVRRRELLNEVTELFFESTGQRSAVETRLFGDLMAKVAFELDQEVRRELSSRFERRGDPPRELAVALVNDTIEVAAPVLRSARSLTDDDLIAVVRHRGFDHQMVVTTRSEVSEAVSDALVAHGSDAVVASLLSNEGARIGDTTYESVLDRAMVNPDLHAPMVKRESIPPHVLNSLFVVVDGPMRKEILRRNAGLSEADVSRAMERARARVEMRAGSLPPDYEVATRQIGALKARGALQATLLPSLWRNGEVTAFVVALADLSGLDFHTVNGLVTRRDCDGLAMIARACGFERALFVTIAVLILGADGMGSAETLGRMYNDVPVEAAQRALRFLKVRQASGSVSAAA
jgi:uncharacterized protein (DUF2336 family)